MRPDGDQVVHYVSHDTWPLGGLGDIAAALTPDGYGTNLHWPECRVAACTGCIPPFLSVEPPRPQLDLSLFGYPGIN